MMIYLSVFGYFYIFNAPNEGKVVEIFKIQSAFRALMKYIDIQKEKITYRQ